MGKWVHKLTQKNLINKTAICEQCGPVKIKLRSNGRSPVCNERVKQEKKSGGKLGKIFKDFPDQDCCQICGGTNNLHRDHDHKTDEPRGYLCFSCNAGIGQFKDSPKLLRKAARYLEG